MRHYKPEYAAIMPKKIRVKLPSGEAVLRSVRWGDFLPEDPDCADDLALEPYVVIDNDPCIICFKYNHKERKLKDVYLVTLSAYLKSYGV